MQLDPSTCSLGTPYGVTNPRSCKTCGVSLQHTVHNVNPNISEGPISIPASNVFVEHIRLAFSRQTEWDRHMLLDHYHVRIRKDIQNL